MVDLEVPELHGQGGLGLSDARRADAGRKEHALHADQAAAPLEIRVPVGIVDDPFTDAGAAGLLGELLDEGEEQGDLGI